MFEIRLATIDDLPDLRSLWRDLMTELAPPYPGDIVAGLNDFTRQLAISLTASPQTAFAFVATVEGKAVGFILYEIQYRLIGEPKRLGFVHHCYVAPAARRQGITNALGEVMGEHMLAQNLQVCEVTYIPGEQLWEHCGWTPFMIRAHGEIPALLNNLDHRRAESKKRAANGLDHDAVPPPVVQET